MATPDQVPNLSRPLPPQYQNVGGTPPPGNQAPNLAQPLPSSYGTGGPPPGNPGAPAGPQVSLTATGPTMRIDINTVKSVIKGWQDVRDKLVNASPLSEPLGLIRPPGNDDASAHFADQANARGRSHSQALLALQQAAQDHIDRLNTVVSQYEGTEHGNAANISRQGY